MGHEQTGCACAADRSPRGPRTSRDVVTCRSGDVTWWESLRRPGRVLLGVVGTAALAASVWVPARYHLADVGGAILFLVVLLPSLTEFEIDALSIHLRVPVPSRHRTLQRVCQSEARQLASIARIAGVDTDQISGLVDEAVEDTVRLWRGRVVEETARIFLICRAVRLIRLSVRMGRPYRIVTPPVSAEDETSVQDMASRPPMHRIVIALVDYAELSEADVAAMLRLDPVEIAHALAPPVHRDRESRSP